MKYASVIVTYNRKNLLLDAINGVLNQNPKPTKIIIIDNNSTDGTEDLIVNSELIKNTVIKYVKLPENVGGSGGFSIGAKIALGYDVDWISLSDDDAIFEPNYFKNISNAIETYPSVKAFSGTIKLEDGHIQVDQRNRVSNWNHFKALPVQESEYASDFEIDLFTFCGCVINADLIKEIGLPRDDFFIWYDDIEYSLRIRQYSKIINVYNSIIVHHTKWGGTQSNYTRDWREYYGIRNRAVTIMELGKNRFLVYTWLVMFMPMMFFRALFKPLYKGNRAHVIRVNYCGIRDAVLGRMGKNNSYMPGQS